MSQGQIRWFSSASIILVWLLLLSHGNPLESAGPIENPKHEKTLQWNQKLVGSIAFAPDGKTVAGCGADWMDDSSLPGALRLWTVATGESKLDMNVPNAKFTSIDFSPDGQKLFSGSYDGTVRIHDLHSLKTEVIPDAIGQDVRVSPDGTQLAITAGQVVRMVDIASKKVTTTKSLKDALDIVPCPMTFSPNGNVIAIAREDRLRVKVYEVEICDPRTLDPIAILQDNSSTSVKTLSYSPDGSLLATGGDDGIIVLWDMNKMKQKFRINVFRDLDANIKDITQVIFSPNGQLLSIGGSGFMLFLKIDTFQVISKIQGQGALIMIFSPDGKFLLTSNSVNMQLHDTKIWNFDNLLNSKK
jgi:WD40 repeat protein